jgi:hypothetical protein
LRNDYLKHALKPPKKQELNAVVNRIVSQRQGNDLSKNQSMPPRERRHGEDLISVVAVGAVFILIGIVFITTPNLVNDVRKFFSDFTTLPVPNTSIQLPRPAHPANHAQLYGAVAQFTLGVGILQILILALRLVFRSPIRRIAQTVGNSVFWLGAAYLTITFLNDATTVKTWFMFWAAILMVLGASLIVRSLVLFARR